MVYINFTKQQIIIQGIWYGLQASFFGSLVFATIFSFLFMWLETNPDSIPDNVLGAMVGGVFMLWLLFGWAVIPSIIGGIVLVWAINKLSQYKPVHVDDAVLIGFVLGLVITAGMEALGIFTLWLIANAEKPNQPFDIFADNSINASLLGGLFLGGLVGGYVGQRFMRHLLAKQEKLLSSAAANVHFTAEAE